MNPNKTKQKTHTIEEARPAMIECAKLFSGPTGTVSWTKVKSERPDLWTILDGWSRGNMGVVYAAVNKMKRNGTLWPETSTALVTTNKTTSTQRLFKGGKPLAPHQVISVQVAEQYKRGEGLHIDWKKAFEDHPDWKPVLQQGFGNEHFIRRASQFSRNYLIKGRGLSKPKAVRSAALERLPRLERAQPHTPARIDMSWLNFCPKCGFRLGDTIRAVSAIQSIG